MRRSCYAAAAGAAEPANPSSFLLIDIVITPRTETISNIYCALSPAPDGLRVNAITDAYAQGLDWGLYWQITTDS